MQEDISRRILRGSYKRGKKMGTVARQAWVLAVRKPVGVRGEESGELAVRKPVGVRGEESRGAGRAEVGGRSR